MSPNFFVHMAGEWEVATFQPKEPQAVIEMKSKDKPNWPAILIGIAIWIMMQLLALEGIDRSICPFLTALAIIEY
ncbi:hypothetical protein ADIS_4655 [Lunatimonas lonarensis]|uniref:Uncharacterized protein n=1 Tax=Lunatimonas lonarensis TaxID=1232681 RepID=R7ZLI6_9BACT|nr:hypothetical protein ADIS_4655 [Lunatimonas lonarensis]